MDHSSGVPPLPTRGEPFLLVDGVTFPLPSCSFDRTESTLSPRLCPPLTREKRRVTSVLARRADFSGIEGAGPEGTRRTGPGLAVADGVIAGGLTSESPVGDVDDVRDFATSRDVAESVVDEASAATELAEVSCSVVPASAAVGFETL